MATNTAETVKEWEEMPERERDTWVALKVCGHKWYRLVGKGAGGKVVRNQTLTPDALKDWLVNPSWRATEVAEPRKGEFADSSNVPPYTTDPAADLAVLRIAREWPLGAHNRFYRALSLILANRLYNRKDRITDILPLYVIDAYEPGDYSHAAYVVLNGGRNG